MGLLSKKAPAKKVAKKAAVKKVLKLKVMRFNVKDGNRYPMEIDPSELLDNVNGDVGLADDVIGYAE
tara:strand:+ start:5 stop:205 length:201 start_codon:yes stop_codon:yes gene_type:complete